ncbi:uncharacterized protein I206_104643 [Kwoniella pini CBS 10737]|uniref:Atos-like conserved domain-containing protein n=1 Tax=Kwoniella pini CBS 10737 TaxID=1296096 RepID=A0A1B9I7D5_9TREE|nr:uncharacterized protein I206_02179 [Kwoniella pini CBS 10737]OCF51465.1 hypothetical protein I206_02179 [Kwoniella pini CBS 10737]
MTYIQSSPRATTSTPISTSFSSSYNSSPIRHSPLSQPPIVAGPSRTPSPSTSYNGSKPIPTLTKRASNRSSFSPLTSLISPSSPTYISSTKKSPITLQQDDSNDNPPTPSPPLSRSQPLLGSYHLSLLHSRMSHAHQPHELVNAFSLTLMGVGKGKNCPRELKFPKAVEIPFSATYYDLFNPESSSYPDPHTQSNKSSPWTSTVKIEDYYYRQFSSYYHRFQTGTRNAQPPSFPGYQVASVGQLQILIKSSSSPVKVFLLPYDLRKVPLGGRLLVREKTYTGNQSHHLKYAIQLQFVCVPSSKESSSEDENEIDEEDNPYTTRKKRISTSSNKLIEKSYYVSKSLKLVFVTTPPDQNEMLNVDRRHEIIDPPAISDEDITRNGNKRRKNSFAFSPGSLGKTSEDWNIHRSKWYSKRIMVDQGGSSGEDDMQDENKSERHNVAIKTDLKLGIGHANDNGSRASLLSSTSPSPLLPLSPTSSSNANAITKKPILSPIPILSPLPMRPGGLNHSRPIRSTSPRPTSPHVLDEHGPALIWSPRSQRRMRREDGLEEVELSEKLRKMRTNEYQK